MKPSRFNFFVPYKDRTICFNSFSGKIFSVNTNDELSDIYKLIDQPNLYKENTLIPFLFKNNYIVNKDTNEVELFKLNNRKTVFDNGLHLIINPTQQCNFNCWYCYESSIKGHMSDQTIENIKMLISDAVINKKIKKLVISWFGGEPLLFFNKIVFPISIFAKQLCQVNNVEFINNATSNGFLLTEDKLSKIKDIDLLSFQITLDGDKKTHDLTRNHNGKASFDIIIKNIIKYCKEIESSFVTIRVNYTNDIIKNDFTKILNCIPFGIRNKIRVNFQRVWQTRGESNKQDLLRGIKAVADMKFTPMLCGGFTLGKSHHCYVDKYNFAHINFDGKVYRCTARDYKKENQCGKLSNDGTIEWNPGLNEKMFTKANFDNNKCLSCKLLPMCTGPCFQNYKDYKEGRLKSFCFIEENEIDENDFIIQYYLDTKRYAKKN